MLGLQPPRRRRPGLTPMIDVVFLLLVFFMLAARFGLPQALPLTLAGQGGAYEGAPRLVTVLPDGVLLNGVAVDASALGAALAPLGAPDALVVLRPGPGTDVQRLIDVTEALRAAGRHNLAVVE